MLLAAGLRNPTVRGRYVAVRELLNEAGHGEFHETLIGLLGSERILAERAAEHVARLAQAFDAATERDRSSFHFAADIQPCARPAAIDASLETIARGHHREAMFWIAVTWRRCMKILGTDGGSEILADLGLSSASEIGERRRAIERTLPKICAIGDRMIG